MIPGI